MTDITALTTFGIKAEAAAVATWRNADDLRAIMDDRSLPRPFKIIGGGSNLLFTGPFGGTVLRRTGPAVILFDGTTATADGHTVLDDLCGAACAEGLRGLENLSGIPGTLGGALVQNAGAYGAETGMVAESVELFDCLTGETFTADPGWMAFGYRTSRLKAENGRYVVMSARMTLKPTESPASLDYGNLRAELEGVSPTPQAVRDAILAIRDRKLPRPETTGSAGSFFRNPEVDPGCLSEEMPRYILPDGRAKVPAAWLIDRCGLKGRRAGGAMVWESQPLVIVNATGNASAGDVLELERLIVTTVQEKFGITLTPEVEHI